MSERITLKKIRQSVQDPESKKRIYFIICLLAAGLILMNWGTEEEPLEGVTAEQEQQRPGYFHNLESELEQQLYSLLKESLGTSNISVMVNVASTERTVYEKNELLQQDQTTDQRGDDLSRSDRRSTDRQVVQQEGPLISHVEKPTVLGVLIVAEGADNIKVKKSIIEAVARVLDISTHRVAVVPYQQEES